MKRTVAERNRSEVVNGICRMSCSCAVSLAMAATSFASTITLQWDPVTAPDLVGYKVYYSPSADAPFTGTGAVQGASPVDVTSTTSATITGLDPGQPYYFAVTAYNTAGVESPYSNIVTVPELIPPTVSLVSPVGTTAASGTVPVAASATDNVGVTKVEFYVNGSLAATETTTPYAYSWDTSSVASGAYTLTVKAYDAAGNFASDSLPVTVVHDTIAPTISLAAPANGATIQGIVPINANATDDVGVTKVELYANDALLSAGNVPPFTYNWDTTAAGNGSYTLSARAYDAAGNAGECSVAVNVLNDSAAPVITSITPADGSKIGASVTVVAAANDDTAVTGMELYIDGVLKMQTSTGSLSWTWNTRNLPKRSSHVIKVLAFDAANNVGSQSVTVRK